MFIGILGLTTVTKMFNPLVKSSDWSDWRFILKWWSIYRSTKVELKQNSYTSWLWENMHTYFNNDWSQAQDQLWLLVWKITFCKERKIKLAIELKVKLRLVMKIFWDFENNVFLQFLAAILILRQGLVKMWLKLYSTIKWIWTGRRVFFVLILKVRARCRSCTYVTKKEILSLRELASEDPHRR